MLNTLRDIKEIVAKHTHWRSNCLNMVASENIVSQAVRSYLSCDFGHRYGTFYEDASVRNYRGNRYIAEMEVKTLELAKDVFKANYVDFRALGGQMAGTAVISVLTRPGDIVFEVSDYYFGHKTVTNLTHPRGGEKKKGTL